MRGGGGMGVVGDHPLVTNMQVVGGADIREARKLDSKTNFFLFFKKSILPDLSLVRRHGERWGGVVKNCKHLLSEH